MTIPKRLQVFSHDVRLSDADFERLKPLMSSWSTTLNDILGAAPESDLEKMVIIELMTLKREHILTRLVNRLSNLRLSELRAKVGELL